MGLVANYESITSTISLCSIMPQPTTNPTLVSLSNPTKSVMDILDCHALTLSPSGAHFAYRREGDEAPTVLPLEALAKHAC